MRATGGVLAVATSLSFAFAVSEGLHWYAARRCLPRPQTGRRVQATMSCLSSVSRREPAASIRCRSGARTSPSGRWNGPLTSSSSVVAVGRRGPVRPTTWRHTHETSNRCGRIDWCWNGKPGRPGRTWRTRSHTLKARGRSRWRRRRCTRRVAVPTWRYNVPIWRGGCGQQTTSESASSLSGRH